MAQQAPRAAAEADRRRAASRASFEEAKDTPLTGSAAQAVATPPTDTTFLKGLGQLVEAIGAEGGFWNRGRR